MTAVLQDVLMILDEMPEFDELVTDGIRLTELMAGPGADRLDQDIAKFAVNGLLAECRHPGERSDDELRDLCETALRRLLTPARPPSGS
jgi:hypothetical protein